MDKIDFSVRTQSSFADNVFVERWSPRSFDSFQISDAQLKKIIDAARWAPSCSNEQPWQFFTAKSDTPVSSKFVTFLSKGNQDWAKSTSVLGFVVSKNFFERKDKPNTLSSFDCGAAWMSLALQASFEGLHTHGMGGIDRERIADFLELDSTKESVLMGFAIGKLADKLNLKVDTENKNALSVRKELTSIWKNY